MNKVIITLTIFSFLITHYLRPTYFTHRMELTDRRMPASDQALLDAANITVKAGSDLIREGKYAEAEAILAPAVDSFPGHSFDGLKSLLGESLIRQSRPKEALAVFLELNPGRSDYPRLGYLQVLIGDIRVSRKMWDDFPKVHEIRRDPFFEGNWPDVDQPDGLKAAWLIACGVITGTGDPRGGDFYLNAAQKLVPNNPILLNLLGNEAFGAHRYAEAANYFERAARDAVGRLKDRCESDAKMARLIADGYKKLGKGGS
jgi:tetratricopeptide (TPR) repeat protein